jgi:hypothetical protein
MLQPVCSIPDTAVRISARSQAGGPHLVADNGVTLACYVFESRAINNNDPEGKSYPDGENICAQPVRLPLAKAILIRATAPSSGEPKENDLPP